MSPSDKRKSQFDERKKTLKSEDSDSRKQRLESSENLPPEEKKSATRTAENPNYS